MNDTEARAYAYAFTNTDAPAYAREALETGSITHEDDVADWAHETADSMAAVIYTGQALALYAAGITCDEDDDAITPSDTSSAVAIIDGLVVGLSYEWHRRILTEAAEAALEDDEPDIEVCVSCYTAHAGLETDDIEDQPEQPAPWALEDATMYTTPLRTLEASFSWSPCHACGSALGGDRYGMRALDRIIFA